MNKLFGRHEPLPAVVEQARTSLSKLAETQPDLRDLSATTAALLRQMYLEVPVVVWSFTGEQVARKLEGGVPLLRGEHLVLDGKLLQKQFEQLGVVMETQGHPAAKPLTVAVRQGQFDVLQAAQAILLGDPTTVVTQADAQALDAELTATLLRLTLFPLLEQISSAARPLRPDDTWSNGYCPTCGAWPLLGEYRGLEQKRWLRCGLCADEWPLDRLMCFACGSRVYSDLHYLEVAGEELKQRVHTCEQCHSYIKQISTLDRLDSPALLVADVATLHLDLIAMERAYSQPQ
ncbi:MAG: formate dehydrogenase accessory protein FdhE [Herpetosiphonaceae bacterium]|nr:formate dehydrogenase accessory protein FdhE [Herpetosiphonaceae bacterium]